MASLAALVNAPVDWLAEIPGPRAQVIARFVVDDPDPIGLLTRLVGDTADLVFVNAVDGERESYLPGESPDRHPAKQRELRDALLNELHDFLCSETRYSEERRKVLHECSVSETSFVAAVTAAIGPHVGGSGEFIVAGVAVLLSIAGKMTLRAWCAVQKKRRSGAQDERTS